MPEFIFGNAVASSKASTETQMPVFIEYIKKRRSGMVSWLTQVAEIGAMYMSLVSPMVDTTERPQIQWDELDQGDGNLTLETLKWAFMEGLIDSRTALMLAPVEFEDIDALLVAAQKEREEREQAAMDRFEQEAQAMAGGPNDDEELADEGPDSPSA